MGVEVVTREDLEKFRLQLLADIRELLLVQRPNAPAKKWLRSHEVREMLSISPGTLQNLGLRGILHPTKISGINYYAIEEVERMLQGEVS